jgi:hypothetical protein
MVTLVFVPALLSLMMEFRARLLAWVFPASELPADRAPEGRPIRPREVEELPVG